MKKIYLSPAIETLEVRSAFAICEGSNDTGGGTDPGFMPKRPTPAF